MPIDLNLLGLVDAQQPRMNKKIINNIAVNQVNEEAEAWIHDTIRCASESFPPGLIYTGGKRCTPVEQFREITRQLKPTRSFDLLRSDVYLMKYQFKFKGTEVRPHYSFLPFISDGGIYYLKGTQYLLTPVVGGKVFNIEKNSIYMPTPKIRMGFHQKDVSCYLNNRVINSSCVTSYLMNGMKEKERAQLNPTLVHYMLAEYGLPEMLRRLFKVNAKIGKQELDQLDLNEWMVYRSRQLPPVVNKGDYTPTEIRIAINKGEYYPLLDGIIATIFYIIDNCSDNLAEVEDLAIPDLWLILLDRFIYRISGTERKQYEKMETHLQSTKSNMDPITRRVLASDNIHCNDIFELFHYICVNFQDIVIHHDVGSMYYKELSTVKHLLYHVVYNIHMAMYMLQKLPENLQTVEKINNIMMKKLTKDAIFTTMGHGELTPISIATDCKMFAATCNTISHGKATVVGGNKRAKKVTNDPGLLLHASQAEVGTYQWIGNKDPLGREKMNPFVNFGERTYITPRPELEEEINSIRQLLGKHKISNLIEHELDEVEELRDLKIKGED